MPSALSWLWSGPVTVPTQAGISRGCLKEVSVLVELYLNIVHAKSMYSTVNIMIYTYKVNINHYS